MEETKRCPYCGEEILALAIKCKHCKSDLTHDATRRMGSNTAQPPKTRLGFKIVGWIIVILSAGAGLVAIFGPDNSQNSSPASTSDATRSRTVYQTSAEQLFKAYNANEVATDQKIGGALVEVDGQIASIEKDFMDHAVLHLATDSEFSPVGITLVDTDKNAAASLKKGQEIVVRCDSMKRVLDSPMGSGCTIIPSS